jgi:flagellin-like protein
MYRKQEDYWFAQCLSAQMDSAETVKVVNTMKLFKNEEEAVSPVIGVILMVAIVVILAAVIAAFVFGMAGSSTTAKTIGVTAKYSVTAPTGLTSANNVELTYMGGSDDTKLAYLKVQVNGASPGYTGVAGAWNLDATATAKPIVGSKWVVLTTATTAYPGGATGAGTNKVVVTGKFVDGSEQVVLDTTV